MKETYKKTDSIFYINGKKYYFKTQLDIFSMDSTPSTCTRKFLRMLNKLEHIFDFPHIPSFVTLFSGNQNEPLYFVEVTQKGTTHEDLTESYGHFITSREKFLKEFLFENVKIQLVQREKVASTTYPNHLCYRRSL